MIKLFEHHQIPDERASKCWRTIKYTISPSDVREATRTIGRLAANDMLAFAERDGSQIQTVYVKYRDGVPLASGMSEILTDAEFDFITTDRTGDNNQNVHIKPYEELHEPNDHLTWFADPIVARGNTMIKVLRYLRNRFSYNRVLSSHVVANVKGIKGLQLHLTDYDADGFMNYAYKSTELNSETGFLEDGLEYLPDFGDKLYGTMGEDYSLKQLQEDFLNLWDTSIGEETKLEALVLLLLQRRERHKNDALSWTTKNWIKNALKWLSRVDKITIPTTNLSLGNILTKLLRRGFIKREKRAWKVSYTWEYLVTDKGGEYSAKVYLPALAKKGWLRTITSNYQFLIRKSSEELQSLI